MTNIYPFLPGLVIGCLIAVAIYYVINRQLRSLSSENTTLKRDAAEAISLRAANESLGSRIAELQTSIAELNDKIEEKNAEIRQNIGHITYYKGLHQNAEEKLATQKEEIKALRDEMNREFQLLANRIFEEKTQKFSQVNEEKLTTLLNPLKDNIEKFEKKVDEAYKDETREKATLRQEIKSLIELNNKMQTETANLTKALKGDVKKQGNWGEIILERVLESSGLRKGVEYQREVVIEGIYGERQRPDVIVYLPDKKHIIIDSKVSLTEYDRMIESDESQQHEHLKRHIESLKSHVKELAAKNYPGSALLNAPDFVLMFVPIEASFSVAMQADSELFMYAWERKIAIVSPTTLLVTLQTVASVWKQENQKNNVLEIARLGGQLYDKFVAFTDNMIKVGNSMDTAKKTYSDAMNQLIKRNESGSIHAGTIVGQAEKLKALGATTSKSLPPTLIERALGND